MNLVRRPTGGPSLPLRRLDMFGRFIATYPSLIREGMRSLGCWAESAAGGAGGRGSGWSGTSGLTASPTSVAGPVPTRRDTFPGDWRRFVDMGLRRGAGRGLAGGAGVRLVRGSRSHCITGVRRRSVADTARHLSG